MTNLSEPDSSKFAVESWEKISRLTGIPVEFFHQATSLPGFTDPEREPLRAVLGQGNRGGGA